MRKRYVMLGGELVEVSPDFVQEIPATVSHNVIPDIQPYRSMADGSIIGSRAQHREHLKRHNCVEIGNDSSLNRERPPLQSPPGLKEEIARQVYEKLRY